MYSNTSANRLCGAMPGNQLSALFPSISADGSFDAVVGRPP